MSCPFIDCEGYNEIDCYMSDEYHVQCPIKGLCDSDEPMVNAIASVIHDYIYKALKAERESRKLHNI